MNNTFVVTRQLNGLVTIRVVSQDRKHVRDLNAEEANALNGLLNEAEFEQHISQEPFE